MPDSDSARILLLIVLWIMPGALVAAAFGIAYHIGRAHGRQDEHDRQWDERHGIEQIGSDRR